MVNEQVGTELRQARNKAGLSLWDVAPQAGLTINQVQLDVWHNDYTVGRQIADAIRTALQAHPHAYQFVSEESMPA